MVNFPTFIDVGNNFDASFIVEDPQIKR